MSHELPPPLYDEEGRITQENRDWANRLYYKERVAYNAEAGKWNLPIGRYNERGEVIPFGQQKSNF